MGATPARTCRVMWHLVCPEPWATVGRTKAKTGVRAGGSLSVGGLSDNFSPSSVLSAFSFWLALVFLQGCVWLDLSLSLWLFP